MSSAEKFDRTLAARFEEVKAAVDSLLTGYAEGNVEQNVNRALKLLERTGALLAPLRLSSGTA